MAIDEKLYTMDLHETEPRYIRPVAEKIEFRYYDATWQHKPIWNILPW